MTKTNRVLIVIVLVLAGLYAVCFTDWFRPKPIQISHANRPAGFGGEPGSVATPLRFSLGNFYEVTEIKVVSLAAFQTNKVVQPVWHLVSASGSEPLDQFSYGVPINGMDPAVPGARPERLEPGVIYRMFVHARSARGQHDFQMKPLPGP